MVKENPKQFIAKDRTMATPNGYYQLSGHIPNQVASDWRSYTALGVSLLPVPPATTPPAPTLAMTNFDLGPYPGVQRWMIKSFDVTFTDGATVKTGHSSGIAIMDMPGQYVGEVVWDDEPGVTYVLTTNPHGDGGSLTAHR
jgi:hypothetical protein